MNWKSKILHTSEPDFSKWKNYYNRLENKSIYHSPDYIKFLEQYYQNEAELFQFGNDQNFFYYPYFKRRLDKLPFAHTCNFNLSGYLDIVSSWYYGGPLASSNQVNRSLCGEFLNVFSDYAQQNQFISEFIRFDPNLYNHKHFDGLLPLSKNRKSVYVDLRQTEDQVWMNMEGRARTAIRKAKKLGVKIHVSKDNKELAKFCTVYSAEMERKNAPSHYHFGDQFIQKLFSTLGNNVKLIYAEANGIFISAGIFVYEPFEIVHYYLMGTDNDHIQYQANNLILHEAILYFKCKGFQIFDLQGGREGVYNFKKSFSKSKVFFYTSGIIHNISVYDQLVLCRNRYACEEQNTFFPAYRTKDTN